MEKLNLNDKKGDETSKKRVESTRLTASTGQSVKHTGTKIGGEFTPCENPAHLTRRAAVYDRIMSKQKELIASFERKPIKITLPDGAVKEGTAWETTPFEIARNISPGLADSVVVARVRYSTHVVDPLNTDAADVDGNEVMVETGCSSAGGVQPILWDLTRPLVGDCKLELLKFDDPEGKMVFWHSSAHVLGECLECSKGVHLTIGPPIEGGFYYDCYMGDHTIPETEFKDLVDRSSKISKDKQTFERIVLTKQEALELFADNPFKVQLIQAKIPENGRTSAYRCGPLIDLCRGPHIPHTGRIKALAVTRTSSAYWLGKVGNDSLQRVYGISFPDKQQMKEWKILQEEAAKRDHRKLGLSSELFFFHQLSPGSCFWLPHGAHLFFKLLELIREQYRLRGYQEVITPNLFNMELWNISGHAQHYKENMFCMKVEEQEFALKPMNCPSHCLMFDHRLRSYRELPLRIADCGVLHRNEFSGALSGLTRVRRFQQDDSHIFCREDQIESEILAYLDFLKYIYGIFDLSFSLELSTRPEKALGEEELWNKAESQLAMALDKFAGKGNWRENPGDGAFYGPKIDVIVTDALKRQHQCATVQLDFQLPIRFDLKYKCDNEKFERPVMVHRAIYGSFERFIAILTEHYAGKFPFWMSPRQALVVAIGQTFNEYGQKVKEELYSAGFNVDFDDSSKTLNKKIREGQMALYNYILVVGAKEMETHSVNIRTRDNQIHGTKTVEEVIAMFSKLTKERSNE